MTSLFLSNNHNITIDITGIQLATSFMYIKHLTTTIVLFPVSQFIVAKMWVGKSNVPKLTDVFSMANIN